MPRVAIYDTTLRDGSQGEGISFSIEDKIKIARRLDEAGIDYIEGGWPASNPKDIAFFERAREMKFAHARIAAFGSTRRARVRAEEDNNLRRLAESGAPVVTIFGKTWEFHVTEALRVSLEQNLEMIADSVRYLKEHIGEVIYDAEHFFDGYKANPRYALQTLKAALEGGADIMALCDTNGGALPHEVAEIIRAVRQEIGGPLGIHAHNDSEVAVANSLAAVREGCLHVQGTVNGLGERCGNANLCSIIPNLALKMGFECLREGAVQEITSLAAYVNEVANIVPNDRQPFVGQSAFAHKAGVHVDAILKHHSTYEHIAPEWVGNSRRMLVSELSGGSTVMQKAREYHIELDKNSPETRAILEEIMRLENQGYAFEGAEGSFELLLRKHTGSYRKLFDVKGFRVIVEKRPGEEEMVTEATLKLSVDGRETHTVAEGDGPVHALDSAMRKALEEFYPCLSHIRLTDFKVRVVNVKDGTAAKVRVMTESTDGSASWSTVGVSTNIIEASWEALLGSVEYGILCAGKK
ncbi:MAG: citramalate synthase [Armatimonadetes bacterium]|nr:citramalate synthase [Armatimonadota bacterium]